MGIANDGGKALVLVAEGQDTRAEASDPSH